jgi:hypothetical protein
MKVKPFLSCLFLICILAACRTATTQAPPGPAVPDMEISLAPGQSTTVTGTDLTIIFHAVESDERCPREIECVASGPVTVSLSVQQGDDAPNDFILQTFTDVNGRSPNVQFEGITNRAQVGGYVIQLAAITPYPVDSTTEIEPSAYRLGLMISNQ